MYTAREYIFPASLEEAHALLSASRRNRIIGGGCWMALGRGRYGKLIDVSRICPSEVRLEDGRLILGGAATLRELETSPEAAGLLGGMLCKCVRPIVGVQLRCSATIGGSLYARFGFSDVLTALLACDATVSLYQGGDVPIAEFAAMPYARDIVLSASLPADARRAAMRTLRLTSTDLPILTVAASELDGHWRIAIGARPGRAQLALQAERERFVDVFQALQAAAALEAGGSPEDAGKAAAAELAFGSNMRASAAYRQTVAKALVQQAIEETLQQGGAQ